MDDRTDLNEEDEDLGITIVGGEMDNAAEDEGLQRRKDEDEEDEKVGEREGDEGDEGDEWEGDEGDEDDEPLPPPRGEDKELLFLIEFMVDTLTLFPHRMNLADIDPCALQGATAVVLTFLHFPPMLLNEKDVDPDKRTGGDVIQYNTGKSLMFALTESQFEEPPPIFLFVAATKDMPHAFRFPQLALGKTKIQLSELFKQLFDKYDENPNKIVSKSIKDSYNLMGEGTEPTARVVLYIRLTCMGENIVTEFQKAEDSEEPMLFKSEGSKKVYECKEMERPEDELAMTLPGWGDGKKSCGQQSYSSPPDPDDENFEEIFAEINGSAITVKVEKSKRKNTPKPYHVSEFCDCNIPLPHNLVAGLSDLSLSQVPGESRDFAVNSASGLGQAGGGQKANDRRVKLDSANQLVFNVPPVETLARHGQRTLVYNVNTCHNNKQHGHKAGKSFSVVTDNSVPDGPPAKMVNDPEKDVFVLRIMKRGRTDQGKGTLSLEFKTPKEKIEMPKKPPYYIETAVGPEKKKKQKNGKKKR